jgi:IS5 family transposase
VKADLKTKLIIKATTTPAHVHDSQVFEDLLDEKDQAVLADSAEHEAHLIKLNAPGVPPEEDDARPCVE